MAKKTYEVEQWSLNELFSSIDGEDVEGTIGELEEAVVTFESRREDLTEVMAPEAFNSVLEQYEAIIRIIRQISYFGFLKFAEDTQEQDVQTFMARMQQLSAEIDNRTMFFKLWWKGLEDEVASKLLGSVGDYRYWLEALRLERPYTLSELEEKVVNIKDVNGSQALVTLYSTFTNRYTYQLEVDGEIKDLTREEIESYRYMTDPALRAACYQEQLRMYEKDAPILGQIYQYLVRDWKSEGLDLRGYESPIAMRNLSNDIPDEVVDTLLEVCRQNVSLFHRFFNLKADWLEMDRLRRYDLYAPVVEADKTYEYGNAVEMILESFQIFEPSFADMARKVFDENHIDGEIRKGKQSGAFCATVTPDLTPWLLQSYNHKSRDVSTLAHELGHAIHSLLANQHTALTQQSSLPMAETASTFGEMIFVDYLLEREQDEAVRRDVLFTQMQDSYATIMRQAYFALFEKQAHERIQAGASVDELQQTYLENLQDQFGDSLDLSEDFQYEWLTIPHIYRTPFYVYAYAFGQLLVLSLYRQYKEEGESFKPRYIELLAAGGSASPMATLDKAGIDVRKAAFWQGGFDVLKENLVQLEAIEVKK